MALAISNILNCPKPQLALRNSNLKRSLSVLPPPFVRFLRTSPENKKLVCAAASAAGSSSPDSDLNPYEVLGVSSIEGFDVVKAKYTKKRKEAEMIGDEATTARLEKAYDKLMMSQLTSRKKGMAYGSFKVSKDIKYADKQPIVPWGPRFAKSSVQDMRINLAISAAFAYTGILNLIEFIGSYIPVFLFNNQELIVTTSSAVILYILGSYYR
ncbi:conserved hypothetical protein [Ricinus communis]|uniref:Heat shock protein binding protein n=1 Tax=Ricinus communis TaxID=3988 RepID=B9S7K3_RICCO|nr:conserved hypothetical protein [Ricinus communis]